MASISNFREGLPPSNPSKKSGESLSSLNVKKRNYSPPDPNSSKKLTRIHPEVFSELGTSQADNKQNKTFLRAEIIERENDPKICQLSDKSLVLKTCQEAESISKQIEKLSIEPDYKVVEKGVRLLRENDSPLARKAFAQWVSRCNIPLTDLLLTFEELSRLAPYMETLNITQLDLCDLSSKQIADLIRLAAPTGGSVPLPDKANHPNIS